MTSENNTSSKNNADFYRSTVFLPKTDFPMRGGLPQKEPEILKKWQEGGLYDALRSKPSPKGMFILHDGPPYANGNIHMGHALNKVLKDVVVKSHSMMGYDAPYVPGWDCHGLPIEWKIEEKYRNAGQDKDEVNIIAFREECRNFAKDWVDIQSEQFQRLGVFGDWQNPYLTMTYRAESKIAKEIHKFARDGGLYRGAKPIMWSVVEKTALAEAEIEYKEHKSVTIWVRFPVVKSPVSALEGADIVIWTTTPWTIPSNRALAYSDTVDYGVYQVSEIAEGATAKVGDKLAVAVTLAEDVRESGKIATWEQIATLKGSDLASTVCAHPLAEIDAGYKAFDVPMLSGDFVTDDAGTGFVHIAPGHGEDDFHLGVANGIEVTDNVSDDGKFRDHVALFAGLEVYTQKGKLGDGNFAVLRELANAGTLLAKGSLRHEYPHSWRSKAPLIFRTTPQWFIAMDGEGDIRAKALSEIKNVQWVPEKGEARINAMIENRPDWCISRQRAWGVPIALFVHKETKDILLDDAVMERVISTFEAEGADAWWTRDASDFLGASYNADDYEQIFDIVDVWFESGSTHEFVVGDDDTWACYKGVDKIDLYLEGSDQHRGWFHSSLLESVGTKDIAPYKAVLTHGFVLDDKGYKMSKSAGNVVDPLKIIKQSGADILRLWTLNSNYEEDIRIGKDMLKSTSDIYRRIRNTLRFLLGALEGFSESEKIDHNDYKNMPELERLMLHQLFEMDAKVKNCITNYDFMKMTKALHEFCNQNLSSFYFDIRKDRLYCDRPDSFERRSTRTVMAHIYDCLVSWFAPIVSFTAEEAWSYRPQGLYGVFGGDFFADSDSVHLRNYAHVLPEWQNSVLAESWKKISDIRNVVTGAIEPYRKDKTIGSSLEAAPIVYLQGDYANVVKALNIADICIVSQVDIRTESAPDDAFTLNNVDGVGVVFSKAEGQKCERCWKVLPEVGSDPDYPDLTLRDADAVRWYLAQGKTAEVA